MSRIVQAINAMIENKEKITSVVKRDNELFFLYKGKYVWGIISNDGHFLYYYPGATDPLHLANLRDSEWEDVQLVSYSSKSIGTREAAASFAELYGIVAEKAFGIDVVLDDIIDDAFDPFKD